jgi:hypothetical protein
VLLGSGGSLGTDAGVAGARYSLADDVVEEHHVVGDDAGGEMALHTVQVLEHKGELALGEKGAE